MGRFLGKDIKQYSSILCCLAVSYSALVKADYVGFASGAEFHTTPIEGTVIMECEGFNGTSQAVYNCRDVILDPQSSDYFIGPKGQEFDRVTLTATHEDGSSRIKNSAYNSKEGRSLGSFNLWISTLFQKPLLMRGVNHIHYTVAKGSGEIQEEASSKVLSGDFQVTVKSGGARRCATTQYHSTDVNDCNSQYSVCQRYFQEFNRCH